MPITKRTPMPKHPKDSSKDTEAYQRYIEWLKNQEYRKKQQEQQNYNRREQKIQQNQQQADALNKQKEVVMYALEQQAKSIPFKGEEVKEAAEDQRQQKVEKAREMKRALEATLTAAELATATYGVARGLSHLQRWRLLNHPNPNLSAGQNLNNYLKWDNIVNNMDRGQVAMSGIGAAVDGVQLLGSDNSFDTYENTIEGGMGLAGVIGGTNILRGMPFLGKFGLSGNKLDDIFDWAGYSAAGWDIVKNIPPLNTVLENLRKQAKYE